MMREPQIEELFIKKLQKNSNTPVADIRDRNSLERNFEKVWESLNRVRRD